MRGILGSRRWRPAWAALLLAALLPLSAASAGGSAAAAAPPAALSPRTTAARPLPASVGWAWPLAGRPRLVHGFDPPDQPWLAGHRGVDLLAAQGAAVRAPTAGVVSFAGTVVDRPVLTITTADGLRLSFEPVKSTLRKGETVARGQPVGTLSGITHCDAGPPGEDSCLHWGVRRGDAYLNPLQFILDLRPSVLLPVSGG
ncbi:murein hydrolase activator EnvC [Arthrobacter sp. SDTb3-6]|uniref:murein hydrolase activator EnvC family protein n=1 Tax=Arthrobacter sp. SDTb3-6 TaxID=2713571 RepID=UPI00210E9916|nr:M23 family metallopeptidase [Arthrobacter sp. SDTb3-6]